MTLPAIETLAALGVAHEVRRFPPEFDAPQAAAALGLPLGAVLKTLAVASMEGVVLCCLGSDRRLDVGRLGEGRIALVSREAMPRMTGFAPGAATPIPPPQGRRFPVVIDEAAMDFPQVGVGAGEVGVELLLSPRDLARACDATVKAIALG